MESGGGDLWEEPEGGTGDWWEEPEGGGSLHPSSVAMMDGY